jgi:hypothetical protein
MEGAVTLGRVFPLNRFPALLDEHLSRYPRTPNVEQLAAEVIAADFEPEGVRTFVTEVCEWGGYAGIAGRVLKDNSSDAISRSLREAFAHLDAHPPEIPRALVSVNGVCGLGTPSYASKHLRFLRPDICPVYDDVLRNALPYSFNPDGYGAFAEDCRTISVHLSDAQIENPIARTGGAWYAADVEAAIYVFIKQWLA